MTIVVKNSNYKALLLQCFVKAHIMVLKRVYDKACLLDGCFNTTFDRREEIVLIHFIRR